MEFVIKNEDHTIGNLLQYELLQDSDVEFVGYIIEHPNERNIKFNIRTKNGVEVKTVFNNAIKRLIEQLNILKNQRI